MPDLLKLQSAFVRAWNTLFELQLPCPRHRIHDEEDADDTFHVLIFLPIAAAAAGLAAYIACWAALSFLTPWLASALMAFAVAFFWDLLSHGKESSNLAAWLTRQFTDAEADSPGLAGHSSLFLFLIRVLCLGVIIHSGHLGWLVAVMAMTGAVQASLSRSDSDSGYQSIIECEPKVETAMWAAALAASLLFTLSYFPATIIALACSLFYAKLLRSRFISMGETNPSWIGIAGKGAEFGLLLLGAALVAR